MPVITTPGKTIDGVIYRAAGGDYRQTGDFRKLKHGREDHVGFQIGHYLQAPPLFFTRDGHGVPLLDMYRGCSAFLIAGGPSFGQLNHTLLRKPGVLTIGMNNSVKTFRPNMWCCVDDPTHFIKSIWVDPKIMKFVPFDHAEKPIIDSTTNPPRVLENVKVGDCPNVWYYRRNEYFVAERFLFEDTLNWGNHSDIGGARSVLLPTIRILFLLGVRRIFLLGVDFNMSDSNKYHFDQDRSRSSINGNNSTYSKLIERFKLLRPIFEKHGLMVYNCNPDSQLKVFDHMPFEEAIKIATADMPDTETEPTAGLYDREAKQKNKDIKEQVAVANAVHGVAERPEILPPLDDVVRDLNTARSALHEAKAKAEDLEKCPPSDPRRANITAYKQELEAIQRDVIAKRKIFRGLCEMRDRIKGTKK